VRCEEKSWLLDIYKATVASHSAAVNDMTLTRGKTPKREYERIWAWAEKARVESEAASRVLYAHWLEHGC
jgi:hypothetical protein